MQIEEARRSQSELAALLAQGIEELDLQQVVEFKEYRRSVLPLDGYVFWIPAGEIRVQGSLHHMQEIIQNTDETIGLAGVTFTTQQRIEQFSNAPIDSIFVATRGQFRFAFSRQNGYFDAASLWHYQGHSIYPAMASQLLDDPAWLDPNRAVVSNSLPIWLALSSYASPYLGGFSNQLQLYPSMVVPPNLTPPYGVIDIPEEATRALQSVPQVIRAQVQATDSDGEPIVDSEGDPVLIPKRIFSQLMADRVRLTLYGLQHAQAANFYGAVMEYIGMQGPMGLLSVSGLRDGKRGQTELQAIAMQKHLDLEVSYQMAHVESVARQLITSASTTFYFNS